MKKISILVLLALVGSSVFGQMNLVPNPSFEDTVGCPTLIGQVTKAKFWYDINETPDYFNACSPVWQASVPYNFVGFQYPHSGDAYMGLCTYSTVMLYREIIGAYLITPLVVGQKYYLNLKVCTGFRPYGGGDAAATNKLGVLFSTVDYISNPSPINNFSQIFTDSIISDTINWSIIKGSFIADSAYTFISIGNFFDDANTDTMHLNNFTGFIAYYYIDDVCVSTDSLYSEVWTALSQAVIKEQIKVFPNPVNGIITIENIPFNTSGIDIINLNGKIVRSLSIFKNNQVTNDLSDLMEGVYIIIVRRKNGYYKNLKFIKSNN
jgi:hypothetical protein